MVETIRSKQDILQVLCLGKQGKLLQSELDLEANLRDILLSGVAGLTDQLLRLSMGGDQVERSKSESPIDLSDMYEGELPILAGFLAAVEKPISSTKDEKWIQLLELFGKFKTLKPQTASFTIQSYSSIARLEASLTKLGLKERFLS